MSSDILNQLLSGLTPREVEVLKLRFGLEDGRSRTFEEVGKRFQVTRERIRQIEAKSICKLRHPTRRHHLDGYIFSKDASGSESGESKLIARILGITLSVEKPLCKSCGSVLSYKHKTGYCRRCLSASRHSQVICSVCNQPFTILNSDLKGRQKRHKVKLLFCSRKCWGRYTGTHYSGSAYSKPIICPFCKKTFIRSHREEDNDNAKDTK